MPLSAAECLRVPLLAPQLGGGAGASAELVETLQATQQATQGQVLALQTHLRALLRKAEVERGQGAQGMDKAMLDDMKGEVQAALSELHGQVFTRNQTSDGDELPLGLPLMTSDCASDGH